MGGEGHSYHFIYTQHISDSSFLVPLFTNFLSLTLLFLPCRRPPAPSFTASHICRYVLALEFAFWLVMALLATVCCVFVPYSTNALSALLNERHTLYVVEDRFSTYFVATKATNVSEGRDNNPTFRWPALGPRSRVPKEKRRRTHATTGNHISSFALSKFIHRYQL